MSHTHTWWRFFQAFCALFCLVILLSACNQLSRGEPLSTSPPGQTATSTPGQACPARGKARAALMPPLPAGLHPQLIYVFQQGDTSILQRYDVTTGLQQTILQTQAPGTYNRDNPGERIADANVSPDGQWVLLKSVVHGQAAIQLVRVDGQHFQTLYCAPAQAGIDDALLSPDQHTLVFNQEDENALSTLYLLDLTTGKVRTALSPLQPNYPEIAQGQQQTILMAEYAPTSSNKRITGNLHTHPFNPLPSKHYLIYVPMKWANNNSVYLFGMVRASGAPLHTLALLRDIRKDVTQQGSNLQLIPTAASVDFSCRDDDVTPDNAQVVCSTYYYAPDSPNAIKMRPITGGAFRTVYQGPPGGRIVARVLSNSTLIFLLDQPNGPQTLWKMHADGSGLTQLMAAQTTDMQLDFASSSYLPWSITSHNGRLYALNEYNQGNQALSLVISDLSGGFFKTITLQADVLRLAGWAEF